MSILIPLYSQVFCTSNPSRYHGDDSDWDARLPFQCIRPGVDTHFLENIYISNASRHILPMQQESFLNEDTRPSTMLEHILGREYDLAFKPEMHGCDFQYSVRAKRNSDFRFRKLGYFRPCSLDISSPFFTLTRGKAPRFLHHAHPSGLGIVHEYSAFMLNEISQDCFFLPMALPMHIAKLGDGLMKILPMSQEPLVGKNKDVMLLNRLVFHLLSMSPFCSDFDRESPSKLPEKYFHGMASPSVFAFPDTMRIMNSTLLAFRSIPLQSKSKHRQESLEIALRVMDTKKMIKVLDNFRFPLHVHLYAHVALETVKACFFENGMTLDEIMSFMYTTSPVPFMSAIFADIHRASLHNYDDMVSRANLTRHRALKKFFLKKQHEFHGSTSADYFSTMFKFHQR